VANCFRTSKEVHAYAATGATREHNWCRLARLNQLAREHEGDHDAATLARALGDTRDAYDLSRHRPCGNVVAALHNLDAWIASPGEDTLHLAVGRAPRNTGEGYVGLRLSALFAGRVETVAGLETPLANPDFRRGLNAMAEAARLHFEDNDLRGALAQLNTASLAMPDEPMLSLLRGALALRLGDDVEAAALLEGHADEETSPYRRGLLALLEGHAANRRGQLAAARAHYLRVPGLAGDVDPSLQRRALRAQARGFSKAEARRLVPDIVFGDVV
jgi:predicted Zn-dependent protease